MGKKIIIIGDYEIAKWHPLKGVDEHLIKILDGYDITIKADYSELTSCELKQYDLLICYTDAWRTTGTKQAVGAILSYIAEGGKILSLHSGIIMRTTPEMELMQGARFTGHPEACDLVYTPTESTHAIMNGITQFTIFEEPYRFAMDELAEPEMLLTYSHEGADYPAAWVLPYGMGDVVYLSMGHSAKSFETEMFRKMILNSVEWCIK
jgi:Uncharacterized protein conserved in bacteria